MDILVKEFVCIIAVISSLLLIDNVAAKPVYFDVPGYGKFSFDVPSQWNIEMVFSYGGRVPEFKITPLSTKYSDFKIRVTPEFVRPTKVIAVKTNQGLIMMEGAKKESPMDRLYTIGDLSLSYGKETSLNFYAFAENKGHYFLLSAKNEDTKIYRNFGYGVLVQPMGKVGEMQLVFSYKSNTASKVEISEVLKVISTTKVKLQKSKNL